MAYSDLILAEPDLQSYWRMEEASGNIADSQGSITGTTLGSNTYNQTGLIIDGGKAILIDPGAEAGACGFDMGDVYPFLALAPFSVEAWVKPGVQDATGRVIASKEDTDIGPQFGWYVAYTSTAITFRRRSPTVNNPLAVTFAMAVGTRYHVVSTFDGSNMVVYVNGAAIDSPLASTASILSHAAPFRVGSHSQGGSRLRGTIDEVAIYDAALSAASILEHYEVGSQYPVPVAWLGV